MDKNIKLLVENIFDEIDKQDQYDPLNTITMSAIHQKQEEIKRLFELIETGNNSPNHLELRKIAVGDFVIPEGITVIGDYAFAFCEHLTSITIPDSVTRINVHAFVGCYGLTEVHITDLTKWCQIKFENINANPLQYADYLYINGKKITNIEIPNTVTAIKNCAFSGYKNLSEVTIPNSVTKIGKYAFLKCDNLTSVIIPNSVKKIDENAFSQCTSLTSIIIDVNPNLKISTEVALVHNPQLVFYVKSKKQKQDLIRKLSSAYYKIDILKN